MYADSSLKKMGLLALLGAAMYGAVYLTFTAKEQWYGSTPPFASLGLAIEEISLRIVYTAVGGAWKMGNVASAAFGLIGVGEPESTRPARAIPILTYHRIVGSENDLNNVTARNFRDQMFTLKRAGWETITLEEYAQFMRGERTLPERSVVITFDDGAKESFYPVDPIFQALGYEGSLFIIENAAHTPESTYYLSPTEIQRMIKTGRWEIGSHSFDGHRPYPADAAGSDGIFFADKLWLPERNRAETSAEFTARVRNDLSRARAALEAEYGVTVDIFAFPLGNETGIEGVANFPEGASITEREASKLYSTGFLQTSNGQFTYNYPEYRSFIARRIHVDYDWDGKRLLDELERGLPKDLPLQDDFSSDAGWIPAWGNLSLGRNNFLLRAEDGASSASAFLDGTGLWDDYTFDATINWDAGFVSLLADLTDAKTYHSCAFGDGVVRLQRTVDGKTTVLAEKKDVRIAYGENVRPGIRVHGSVIECSWNYASILEVYDRKGLGGIGMQVWQPELGEAHVQVSEILVRPYDQNS